ncbi:MAG: PAS domain S-box protein [Rhodospirillales bacterium]|nr:PAS domain S-box protein [Rhodospirillales bacterium]
MLGIVVFLWNAARNRFAQFREGWNYIVFGFVLLLFGSVLDISDNFESLNRFIIVGDTETEAILEKFVGFLGGFIFLAVGLFKWVPGVQGLSDLVDIRTARLEEEIEQREQAELARLESEEKVKQERNWLNDVVNSFKDGFALFDADDKLIIFNDQYQSAIDQQSDGLKIGMSFEDVARTRAIHFESNEKSEAYEEWVKTRVERHFNPTGPFELNFDNGQFFQIHEFRTKHGGIAILRIDITDQKKSEQKLLRSEKRFHRLIDTLNYGVLVHRKRVPLYANSTLANMYGYNSADEILALPSTKLLTHPDFEENTHDIRLGNTQQIADKETMGVKMNGAVFWEDRRSFVINWDGEDAICSIRSDISERKKVDSMKSEFISTVSHELRTPLTSIKGSLGLITDGILGAMPDTATSMIEIAYRNTDRLINLVNDILDMEKIESGSMEFEFKKLSLTELVADAVETNKGYADEHGVTFVLADRGPKITVEGDANRLVQVIANLLSNAAKFSPKGENVEISVTRQEQVARVSVSDHGPGIPEQYREQIFGRFTQVDSSDSREKGGTGLGLNISKSIIEKHEGAINFESNTDVGSTFFFTLPISE